jgi:hypothetical protein
MLRSNDFPASFDRIGLVQGTWTDEGCDDRLRLGAIHGKAVVGEFRTQQFGSRLRPGDGPGHRSIIQELEASILQVGNVDGQRRPAGEAARRPFEVRCQPFRLQVAVGAQRLIRLSVIRLGEQVDRRGHRKAVGREVVQLCPCACRVHPPTTGQESLHGRCVPALRQPQTSVDEQCRLAPPHHPARTQGGLDAADDVGGALRRDRN